MSDKQKKYAKWLAVLVALFGGGVGADAAGLDMPDGATLEKLGVVGSAVLIAYIHVNIRPLLQEGVDALKVLIEDRRREDVIAEVARRRAQGDEHLSIVQDSKQ